MERDRSLDFRTTRVDYTVGTVVGLRWRTGTETQFGKGGEGSVERLRSKRAWSFLHFV